MPPAARKPSIALLVGISAVGPMALNIFVPSMPHLQRVFGTSYGVVQLTLSLYLIGLAVAPLVYGPLSDRYGRRPTLLVGLVLFLAGTLLALVAPTIEVLIAARLIQAVGGCAGMVVGRAVVRDLFDRERTGSVLAYMTAAMVVVPMLAPALGGYLEEGFGWRASFVAVAAVGALVLALAVAWLHETNTAPQPVPGLRGLLASYRTLFRLPAFAVYVGVTTFTSAAFFAFIGGAPYVMVEIFDRPPSEFGLYSAIVGATYMAGNFLAGRWTTAVGVDRMIAIGTVLSWMGAMAMLGLHLAGVSGPLMIFGPMAMIGFGNGMSLPNGLAGAISVDPRRAGAASGVAGFTQMGVGAGASLLVGALLRDSATPMVLLVAASVTLALPLCVPLLRRPARDRLTPQPAE